MALRNLSVPESGLVFTTPNGGPLVRRGTDEIGKWFRDEVRPVAGAEKGFRSLRYTFATVASQGGDDVAKRLIMGHLVDGVPERYVQEFPVERLWKVANRVRN